MFNLLEMGDFLGTGVFIPDRLFLSSGTNLALTCMGDLLVLRG